ncbi:MAG: AEC family transporter [Trueperaceae bacterium]
MPLVADALVPLTLLIALGIGLKRFGFLPDAAWAGLDRLNYWVLFPALIFVSLASERSGLPNALPIVASVWGGLTIVALLAWTLRRRLAPDGPAFTSVFQGAVRFNSYVAFLTVPVLHPDSEALTALLVAATVPFVNVACVTALARYGGGAALRKRGVLAKIVTNPLIVASLLGIAAARIDLALGPLEGSLQLLGQASLATGLLAVGATLRLRSVRSGWREVTASVALKVVALPLATAMCGLAFGLPQEVLAPLLLFQAMPTASASYVLARAMRGDERLMAGILAVHTLAALAWLPAVFVLVRWWLG